MYGTWCKALIYFGEVDRQSAIQWSSTHPKLKPLLVLEQS
jgi:hypothetical protein